MRFHLFRHAGTSDGDAVDLLDDEMEVLHQLIAGWSNTGATPASPQTAVDDNWERGTIGKLLIEHCAVRLAAQAEVARVLGQHGADDLAAALRADVVATQCIVERMDKISRGVEPMSLATSQEFADEVEALRRQLATLAATDVQRVQAVVEPFRQEIASEDYVRRHAPTHPSGHWHRSPLVRLQTMYDRLRGVPRAQSTTADRTLTSMYDKEVP